MYGAWVEEGKLSNLPSTPFISNSELLTSLFLYAINF
jgi:hypothetical protein